MMKRLRRKFTKWYIKKGYTFGYDFSGCSFMGGDNAFPPMPTTIPKSYFNCPRYIVPLLIFFSPSVYQEETLGKVFLEGFLEGIKSINDKSMSCAFDIEKEIIKLKNQMNP